MATNNDPNEYLDDEDETGGLPDEGDMRFAGDSIPDSPPPARDDQSGESDGLTWMPSPRLEPDPAPEAPADADAEGDTSKTWVPSETPTVNGLGDDESSASLASMDDTWVPDDQRRKQASEAGEATPAEDADDPNKTWVPSSTPTADGINAPAEEADDPNKTWVPSSTPTADGMSTPAEEDDDPNKTWVPSSTPTADGINAPAEEDDDPNKTWVPSSTPTADGIGTPAEEDDDPNKTWVPSSTPTADGMGTPAEEDDDPNKTWVPEDTPTHHDFSFDKDAGSVAGPGVADGTVVMDGGSGGGAINEDKTIARSPNADADKTQIFSRTMAMRGMSAEEYEQWQKSTGDDDLTDTMALDPPADVSDSTDAKRTQIWSKQSANGLDSSLIIRSRPVTGDADFESSLKGDRPDYEIVEKLAEGGMGAVYIAKQTSLNRELAIKTLKPLREHEKRNYTKQGRMSQVVKQRREMFLSEALVTANLVHPHIIPIHDLCQTVDGSPFYSMKRVIGTPWNELITQMTQEENLEVLHKVCDAIAYAHHNGVVNRDLKPENIMLGEFGEVLVLDWGLAVPSSTIDNQNFTSASASFGAGTPAYMSPELWAGPAEAIGTWSDVYLMGAILFEAITGKPPHEFPEPDSSAGNSGLWKIIDNVVRKNRIRESDVTGELMDIAMKAMHIDPKKRHANVLEFQEAVKAFQTHEASRRLTERAAATLTEGTASGQSSGYQTFQTAAALFEEAHTGWPENESARDGLRDTRLAYAKLAHTKGDYDLGLQIAAQEQGEAFTQLTQKLTKSRRVRNGLKQATMAAAGIIVLIGAFAIVQYFKIDRQNSQIIALYGDKEQLETDLKEGQKKVDEADAKVAAADRKVVAANAKLSEANTQVAAAEKDLADAKAEVTQAEQAATIAKMDAKEASSKAAIAMQELKEADQKAAAAVAAAEKANADVAVAKTEIAAAEAKVAELDVSIVRATVDLRNADIANLIRNSDYSSALRQVEQMLTALDNDPELGKLPQSERERRMQELKARRGQLLKRSRSTESPVQTQVISPSGKTVVWGDSQGTLSLWKLDSAADDLPTKPIAKLHLNAQVSTVRISDDEQLIVAAANNVLHLWTPSDDQHHTIDAHGADITTVVLADGFLLAADAGGAIRSWDLATRKERWSIRSSAGIRDLAVLPKSRMFIYAGSRGGESADVLAYQLPPETAPTSRPERLGQLRLPRNRNNPPQRIAVSPDEKLLLISNSRNGELIILPTRPESEFVGRDRFPFQHAAYLDASAADGWVIDKHKRPINDIAFSADGQRVVTASDDRSIGIWEFADNGNLQFAERLEGHGAKVNAAGFVDAGGSKVLSASADRFCRFWDLETYDNDRREIQKQFDISFLRGIQVSTGAAAPTHNPVLQNRNRYIMTRHNAGIQETEAATDEPEYRIFNADHNKQRGAVRSVVLTPGGERIVTGATDGTAVIWETSTGRPVTGMSTRSQGQSGSGSFDEGHDFNVSRMQFLPPEGNVLLTTGFDGNLCLWNADLKNAGSGTQELRIPGLGIVNAVAVSDNGKLIVTSSASSDSMGNGLASVWSTDDLLSDQQHAPIAVLKGYHRSEVSAVAVSPDGLRVATGARDGRVAIWSITGGELIAGSRIHVKNTIVSHLEWLSDTRVLSAGFDGRMMVVDAISSSKKKLNITATYEHDRIPIERVAFSPDGGQFLTVSVRTDKATKRTAYEMQLWHPESTVPIRNVKAAIVRGRLPSRIAAVNWSPDGRRVAAAVDGNLQVFDSKSWRIQNVLEAPGLGIADAVFAPGKSPDGAEVIATFDGTSAHMWNLNDRTHKADFRPLFAVQAMALSEDIDNPLLLTGDRAIQIFNANPSSERFGQTLFKISDPHAGIITSLQFCPDSTPQKFVSAGADGSAALWQWNAKKGEASRLHQLSRHGASVVSTAWSQGGKHVLLTLADGRVRILNADNPEQALCDFSVQESSAVKLSTAAFSSDGRFFLVAGHIQLSGESRGWVYQLKEDGNPDVHCTIHGHEAGGISSAAFLPDSPYLITGGRDGAAMIWNWQPGRSEEDTLEAYEVYQLLVDQANFAHAAPINSVTVSDNGSIATASDDGTAIVWKNPFAAAR